MKWTAAVLLLVLGTVSCQFEVPDDLLEALYLQQNADVVDDVQNVIRQKCEKNGGAAAFGNLQDALNKVKDHVEKEFVFAEIQDKIALKRKTGEMEEVTKEYCEKLPALKEHIKNAAEVLENCLEESEKKVIKTSLTIVASLTEFGCFRDGDRIALFIAEKGPECIQSKHEGLEKCANETIAHLIPTDFSFNNLPLLSVNTERCHDYNTIQKCVVDELLTCEESTPANLIEALFKYVRKISPCKDFKMV